MLKINLVLILLLALGGVRAFAVTTPIAVPLIGDSPADNLANACGFDKILANAENPSAYLEAVQNANFDPCCLGPDILDGLTQNREVVNGVSIGMMTSVKLYEAGKEIVLLYQPNKPGILVGVYQFLAVAAELELPVGNAVTRAIVYGSCNTMQDYEGYFKSTSLGGWTHSLGLKTSILSPTTNSGFAGLWERLSNHVAAEPTGCNSYGLNTGLATSLLGLVGSHYKLISPVVEITGPRARKLGYLFRRANRDASQRRWPTNEKHRFSDFRKFHEKTCKYEILEQVADHLSITESIRNLIPAGLGGEDRTSNAGFLPSR